MEWGMRGRRKQGNNYGVGENMRLGKLAMNIYTYTSASTSLTFSTSLSLSLFIFISLSLSLSLSLFLSLFFISHSFFYSFLFF